MKSFSAVQSAFRVKFKVNVAPDHQIIKNIVQAFEKKSLCCTWTIKTSNTNSEATRGQKTAWNHGKGISEFVNPQSRLASAVNVSTTLVYSILHDDLHLKPYKFNVWQKLEIDYQKRVDFAQWFLLLAPDAKFRLICSDEASPTTLNSVFLDFKKKCHLLIDANGGHIEL